GLTGAVGPHEAVDTAARHVQRQAVQSARAPVGLDQAVGAQHRRLGGSGRDVSRGDRAPVSWLDRHWTPPVAPVCRLWSPVLSVRPGPPALGTTVVPRTLTGRSPGDRAKRPGAAFKVSGATIRSRSARWGMAPFT